MAVCVPLLMAIATVAAGGQRATQTVRPDCTSSCDLRLRTVFVTDDPEGKLPGHPYSAFETANRSLVVGARYPMADLPVVFDSTGRYARVLGRRGNGPGEIAIPVWTSLLGGDTVRVVMQGGTADFNVDGRHIRDVRHGGGARTFFDDFILFPSGAAAVLGPPRPVGRGGDPFPIRLRLPDGTLGPVVALPHDEGQHQFRVIGRAREHAQGHFWVVQSGGSRPRGYAMFHVAGDGQILRSFAHEPSWWQHFPQVARGRGAVPDGPITYPTHVRERADGLLMVLFRQAKPNWRAIPTRGRGERTDQYEVRVVVIDPVRLAVVGVASVPGSSPRTISDTRFVVYDEDATGEPRLVVYELALPAAARGP